MEVFPLEMKHWKGIDRDYFPNRIFLHFSKGTSRKIPAYLRKTSQKEMTVFSIKASRKSAIGDIHYSSILLDIIYHTSYIMLNFFKFLSENMILNYSSTVDFLTDFSNPNKSHFWEWISILPRKKDVHKSTKSEIPNQQSRKNPLHFFL